MKKAQQELAITDFFNFANENFTSFPFHQWLSQQPLVRVAGLEPARPLSRGILSPLCLPIPPHPRRVLEARVGIEPA